MTAAEFRREMPRRLLADMSALEAEARAIVDDVRLRGDAAVREYAARFDGPDAVPARLEVTPDEMSGACAAVGDAFMDALCIAAESIRRFHERQLERSWIEWAPDGSAFGQVVRPIERVGLYVPGGTAAYPSSVLMGAIPARVAGVAEIVMCTPPGPGGAASPHVLAAARAAAVDRVFKVGGCQAIAAMAFGTESIPRVDKIAGPGNAYVTAAKRLVYGHVDIDMLAGPSELVVLADETADATLVAADLLSQAEHDANSQALLITTCAGLADAVAREVEAQLATLPRRAIASRSLASAGAIVLADTIHEAIDLVNVYAPEHLEIIAAEPERLLGAVRNAGCVLLGPYSPTAASDYAAGPNHVLPTGGAARSASALSVRDFTKVTNVLSLSRAGLARISDAAERLARIEGLEGHARALRSRRER